MASIPTSVTSTVAANSMAALLAVPFFGVLLRELYPYMDGLSAPTAVVMFGTVGAASGFASQLVAGQRLGELSRQVHLLELLPAVTGQIITSVIVTLLLLPPNDNPVTVLLRRSGNIPN